MNSDEIKAALLCDLSKSLFECHESNLMTVYSLLLADLLESMATIVDSAIHTFTNYALRGANVNDKGEYLQMMFKQVENRSLRRPEKVSEVNVNDFRYSESRSVRHIYLGILRRVHPSLEHLDTNI